MGRLRFLLILSFLFVCFQASAISFIIPGKAIIYNLPVPAVSNLHVCSPGDAVLSVNNATAGYGYRLYNDMVDPFPLDDQASGQFVINVQGSRSYYIAQYQGSMESERVEVKVILASVGKLGLPSAFTPNNDGINDTWEIKGMQDFPDAMVQVFTRTGDRIFESKGYASPFDGTYNGRPLPVGVYYYIINFNTGCSLLSGSLTIIR